jgi:hypothetical protein
MERISQLKNLDGITHLAAASFGTESSVLDNPAAA